MFLRKTRPHRPTKSGEEGATERKSPALQALFEQMDDGNRQRVLDLGPASGENVAFFADRACTLHVEDLYTTLRDRIAAGPGRAEELLPIPEETRFDVVLTWDLFNYVDAEELADLASRLARLCRPGALLYAMIGYLAEIPDRPTRYRLINSSTLLYDPPSTLTSASKRYSTRDLSQALRGFRLATSFLLRNGYQEFLFIREEDSETQAEEEGTDSIHDGTSTPASP